MDYRAITAAVLIALFVAVGVAAYLLSQIDVNMFKSAGGF